MTPEEIIQREMLEVVGRTINEMIGVIEHAIDRLENEDPPAADWEIAALKKQVAHFKAQLGEIESQAVCGRLN